MLTNYLINSKKNLFILLIIGDYITKDFEKSKRIRRYLRIKGKGYFLFIISKDILYTFFNIISIILKVAGNLFYY